MVGGNRNGGGDDGGGRGLDGVQGMEEDVMLCLIDVLAIAAIAAWWKRRKVPAK